MATAALVTRATRPRFYVGMAATFVVLAFGGFIPTYWAKVATGSFDKAPVYHLHGLVFFSWTLFYFFQTSLVAAGRTYDHRKWGMAGIALATAMGFTIVMAAMTTMRHGDSLGFGDATRRFEAVAFLGLASFGVLFTLAIVNARKTELHKRLMILAMIPLMQAAVARLFLLVLAPPGADTSAPPPPFVTVPPGLTVDLLIVVAMIYDWRTRGRVHPAYLIGLPALVVQQLLVPVVAATDTWMAFARGVEGLMG